MSLQDDVVLAKKTVSEPVVSLFGMRPQIEVVCCYQSLLLLLLSWLGYCSGCAAQLLQWQSWCTTGSSKLVGNMECTIMFDIFYFCIVNLNFENVDDRVTQKTTKRTTQNSCTVVVTFQYINKDLMEYKCGSLSSK